MKGETTPRLELKAALVLAQLIISVKTAIQDCHKIENIFCWSDSNVVLYWIYNDYKKQKKFVENRLIQIRNLVNKPNWSYCPTQNNPADIVSRGMSVSKLADNGLWWEGPDFLKTEKKYWPTFEGSAKERQIPESEKVAVVLMSNSSYVSDLNAILPCENYSCFDKLIRVTVLVLKFVKLLRREISKEMNVEMYPSDLSDEAKNLWYVETQKSFANDKNVDKTKLNLNVFTDSKGILRSKGRINNAPLPYETRFPIVLPRRHHISLLLVLKSHEIVKHNGVQETLTQLRSEHWIIRGRQLVKSILSKCATCKQLTGKPYDSPNAPPLPPFRVSDDAAFSQIGIDFAGPLFVRDIYSKDKQSHKCYIALFSCASTRAIHLELVPDLQGSTFLRALKRFMGRRGIPARILSDNGKTFTDFMVQKFVNSKGIEWRFNIPKASWWGGMFEIMVKLTKRCLRKTLRNASLRYEELETILTETESILNSRPLTFLYDDVSEPPLTPSCLVTGRRLLDKARISSDNVISDKVTLTKRAIYLETLLEKMFTQWKLEYLTSLRERYSSKNERLRKIPKIGDIVTIYNEKTPRQRWKLGKIERLLPGKDSIVRAVEVRTVDNSGKTVSMKRPIQHLFPIEVEETLQSSSESDNRTSSEEKDVTITAVRDEDIPHIIRGV